MAKKQMMSLPMEAELLEALKKRAKDKGDVKVSEYVLDWLKKLALDKEDIKRVILQVPASALEQKPVLQAWLKKKCDEVVKHYFPEEA